MSDQAVSYSDEIELFDILQTLWTGKILIAAATLLGLAAGLATGYLLPVRYQLTVPFTINYHSLKSEYLCADSRKRQECKQRVDFKNNPAFADFSLSGDTITWQHSLDRRDGSDKPVLQLKTLIESTSATIFEEANAHLSYVNKLSEGQETVDALIREIMKANFIIRQYQAGKPFAELALASMKNSRPSPLLIVALFAFSFLMLACLFVLVRNAHSNWKENQA